MEPFSANAAENSSGPSLYSMPARVRRIRSNPAVNNPKILGVTLDSLCSFPPHTTSITAKVQSRNKILKSLAGSSWGKDKQTLLATYKTIGRPVLNYAALIWSPRCSAAQTKKLRTCQNHCIPDHHGMLLDVPDRTL